MLMATDLQSDVELSSNQIIFLIKKQNIEGKCMASMFDRSLFGAVSKTKDDELISLKNLLNYVYQFGGEKSKKVSQKEFGKINQDATKVYNFCSAYHKNQYQIGDELDQLDSFDDSDWKTRSKSESEDSDDVLHKNPFYRDGDLFF